MTAYWSHCPQYEALGKLNAIIRNSNKTNYENSVKIKDNSLRRINSRFDFTKRCNHHLHESQALIQIEMGNAKEHDWKNKLSIREPCERCSNPVDSL